MNLKQVKENLEALNPEFLEKGMESLFKIRKIKQDDENENGKGYCITLGDTLVYPREVSEKEAEELIEKKDWNLICGMIHMMLKIAKENPEVKESLTVKTKE